MTTTEVTGSAAFPGDRVVVRYRLGAGTPPDWRGSPNPAPPRRRPALSDVTGLLVDDGDPLRIDRAGEISDIPRAAVASIRVLSRVTVRNSDIRAVEHAAALAWMGTGHTWCDGWLLRAGGGLTRRANSAVPLGRDARATPDALAAIDSWYAARGLPTLIELPERLLPRQVDAGPASGDVHLLTRDLDDLPAAHGDSRVTLSARPSLPWLRSYFGDDADPTTAADVITAAEGPVTIAQIADAAEPGVPLATGRAAVTSAPDGTRWAGVTALWTAPAHRRHGLAGAICDRLLNWAADAGAQRAYVQVEADNRVAGRWYRARGFMLHHRYRYLIVRGGIR
ncbi:MAG: GNAT family N-acetyltransferase [Gordonia sp. (in: high G+C Gram-positive bacteria)]